MRDEKKRKVAEGKMMLRIKRKGQRLKETGEMGGVKNNEEKLRPIEM